MTTISDSPDWREAVYEVQKSDRVLGGPDGAVNRQAKDLADRTAYLKAQLAVVSRLAGSYGTLAASLKTRLDRLEGVAGGGGTTDGGVGGPGSVNVTSRTAAIAKSMSATDNLTIPVNDADFFDVTLNETLCVIRLDNFLRVNGPRIVRKVDVMLTQGTGANRVQWADTIRWAYGRPPLLSFERGYSDMVTLLTLDDGDTWIGFFSGGWTLA